MLAEFLESEPSAGQRLVLLCVFVAIGLVFSVQLSQTAAPEPLRWTRLTPETKYAAPRMRLTYFSLFYPRAISWDSLLYERR